MTNNSGLTKSVAQELLDNDSDQLIELLGMTIKAVEDDPGLKDSFEPNVQYTSTMGVMDDLKKIGQDMFDEIHKKAYGLICGSGEEDKEDRDKIMAALGVSWTAGATVIAGVLVSSSIVGAAFAGIMAALIIKRFAKPAAEEGYESLCELWKEHLPQSD